MLAAGLVLVAVLARVILAPDPGNRGVNDSAELQYDIPPELD